MQKLSHNFVVQEKPIDQNLTAEAQNLLAILNELEDFTINLRKKLMAEFKPEENLQR